MTFVSRQQIRFAHCDPAGIAYYPRLLELVDAAVEDWTEHGTGVSRRAMHEDHRLGLPTVALETEFMKPTRLDERLDIAVAVANLGTTSIKLLVSAQCNETPRFVATLVQVLIDLGNGRPVRWPMAWRRTLETAL